MPLAAILGAILLIFLVLNIVLFLIFRFTTVRKLKKNPETKYSLGPNPVLGWQTLNIAQSLVIPQWLVSRLKKSRYSMLFADIELLRLHTNKKDQRQAKIFYGILTVWVFYVIIISVLYQFGLI